MKLEQSLLQLLQKEDNMVHILNMAICNLQKGETPQRVANVNKYSKALKKVRQQIKKQLNTY